MPTEYEYQAECDFIDEQEKEGFIEEIVNKAGEILNKNTKKLYESESPNKLSKKQIEYALKNCMEELTSHIIKKIKKII